MAKATIYFFCPDLPHVLGGVRQTYRHVDVLNANGFDAWIVHRKKGFKVTWFEHDTKVMYEPVAMRKSVDVAVYPEIWGSAINQWGKDIRKVIFNQNCYYTFMTEGLKEKFDPPYLNPKVIATMVVSEDSKRYLEYVFPKMPVYRIRYSINPKRYYPEPKKRRICVMPRKNAEDVKQVLSILRFCAALEGWEVVLIDKFSEAQAAAVMRESAVFLSFAGPEGFGLPGAEAMRCKAMVAGYTGRGGDEFMRPEFCFPVGFGDVVGYAQTVERILKEYSKNSDAFAGMTEKAAAFIGQNYSEERERESISACWNQILH